MPPPPPVTIATSRGNPLAVPWFAQLDSATDQARRMCFSSSCAMLLAFLRVGVLTGSNGDDQVLASYGIKARFTSKASFSTLERQIAAGIPAPCDYLHRGPISSPAGGGHWLIVVGITPTGHARLRS